MQDTNLFPKIVNVTDLRYRWPKVARQLQESDQPILVVEYSTPKAVLLSVEDAKRAWAKEKTQVDPLVAWRKKYTLQLSGWDATGAIRKARDSRWSLS